VGIIGGSFEYTGAPYFAAISALYTVWAHFHASEASCILANPVVTAFARLIGIDAMYYCYRVQIWDMFSARRALLRLSKAIRPR
jgi:amino acid permease